MKIMNLFRKILPLLICSLQIGVANEPETILFVGNSFTLGAGVPAVGREGGVPGLVQKLAAAGGMKGLDVQRSAKVRITLGEHLAGATDAVQKVRSKPWDVVVMQDFSTAGTSYGERKIEDFFADGKRFKDLIRAASPHAKIVLFEPWARHPSHRIYREPATPFTEGAGQMQQELTDSYAKLASEIGAEVAPVGEAFMKCLEVYPEIEIYNPDRYHANNNGGYLAALVLYAKIFGKDPRGLPPWADVTPEDAARFQALAWSVISGAPLASGPSITWPGGQHNPAYEVPDKDGDVWRLTLEPEIQEPGDGLQVHWTKLSGPGEVRFSSPETAATEATFDKEGLYRLQIEAKSGDVSRTQGVTVMAGKAELLAVPPQDGPARLAEDRAAADENAGRPGSYYFDGLDSRLVLEDVPAYGGRSQSFTITFWFRVEKADGNTTRHFFSHGPFGRPASLNICLNEANTKGFGGPNLIKTVINSNGNGLNVPASPFFDGNWHFYALTVARRPGKDAATVYLDGRQAAAAEVPYGEIAPADPLVLGMNTELKPKSALQGWIQDLRISGTVLSPQTIQKLAEARP